MKAKPPIAQQTNRWPERSDDRLELPEFPQSNGAGREALRRRQLREVVGEQLAVEEQQLAERAAAGRSANTSSGVKPQYEEWHRQRLW